MARQVTTTVYQYAELSDAAKEKARGALRFINVDFDWWESIYEDAGRIGLKIHGFDIDRGSYVDAEFVSGALDCATAIIKEHGEQCDTYKTASEYIAERDAAIATIPKDEDGDDDEWEIDAALDMIDAEFLCSLREDYLVMLRNEYEYRTSDEEVAESIKANEYEFTEDGERA